MSAPQVGIEEAQRFIHGPALSDTLKQIAKTSPEKPYLMEQGVSLTTARLDERVDAAVASLRRLGVTSGSRVGLALSVSADHVVLIFALLRCQALWVPLNTQLMGEPLTHQLGDSGVTLVLTEPESTLAAELDGESVDISARRLQGIDRRILVATLPPHGTEGTSAGDRQDACLLMYTSGTTGPPKGALVSETMLKGAVLGALEVTQPLAGDVFYVWEPLFHIGGAQVVFVPLFRDVTLALAPKFSASRFWGEIVDYGVTHIHYLGGVLQILLQLPVSDAERQNRVRVAWGAGATPEVRASCQERFAFALNECYGMTETSSIVTVNRNEAGGGVGVPLPWIDIEIEEQSETNTDAPPQPGEIRVRGRFEGLITTGYLANPQASERARDGEWFRTGDLGYFDSRGRLHFSGRGSDSIRVRGENVSAWQIESIFGLHPAVDRCAVVGVEAEIGDQEMLLLFTPADGEEAEPGDVLTWGAARLAKFQVPRYARIVDELPLTPSQRVAKHRLSRSLEGATERSR